MTRVLPRSRLLAPFVYVVALVLLLEQWCWDAGARLGGRIAAWLSRWAWVAALETRVQVLPPYAALCLFVLPGALLFPLKLLALLAIAHGHAASGIATIVLAKVGGAAVVARLYALTLPTLLGIRWFARGHAWFMSIKERSLARLRESAAARLSARLMHAARIGLRRLRLRLRMRLRLRRRRPRRLPRFLQRYRALRLLRRFAWHWRARRRPTRDLP